MGGDSGGDGFDGGIGESSTASQMYLGKPIGRVWNGRNGRNGCPSGNRSTCSRRFEFGAHSSEMQIESPKVASSMTIHGCASDVWQIET